jgi:hypothetical protein
MNTSTNVGLQTLATVCLGAAVEQFSVHSYLVGSLVGIIGIIAYVVYEIVPVKPS